MAFEHIRLEQDGALAILTIDRPKALNALHQSALEELREALGQLKKDTAVSALIVTGAGDKAFVAGADIAAMARLVPTQAEQLAKLGHSVMDALEHLPFPTLAAVNGFALGGGTELALACDLIYASEKAKFGLPEVGLGVIPGFGGTQRLMRRIGPGRAMELIFTGEMIDAPKAKAVGLALDVLAPDQLLPYCRQVAEKIAKKSPLAVATAKRAMHKGAGVDLHEGCELEQKLFAELFGSADQREGMAAFLEKRPPQFRKG